VVWIYYERNDLTDLQDEITSPLFRKYMDPEYRVGLPERQGAVDAWLTAQLDSAYEAELARADAPPDPSASDFSLIRSLKFTQLRSIIGFPVHFPVKDPIGTLPDILRLGRDAVAGWDGELVFVYMPAYNRYRFLGDEAQTGRDEVLSAADSLGIRVLDVHSYFSSSVTDPRDLWVHPNGHLNPRGYSIVARAVEELIAPLLGETDGSESNPSVQEVPAFR
jgi:hypothetical protein